jgi:hypothetical protein
MVIQNKNGNNPQSNLTNSDQAQVRDISNGQAQVTCASLWSVRTPTTESSVIIKMRVSFIY